MVHHILCDLLQSVQPAGQPEGTDLNLGPSPQKKPLTIYKTFLISWYNAY